MFKCPYCEEEMEINKKYDYYCRNCKIYYSGGLFKGYLYILPIILGIGSYFLLFVLYSIGLGQGFEVRLGLNAYNEFWFEYIGIIVILIYYLYILIKKT